MYTELGRMSNEIDEDVNLATQHIFDRITDYKLRRSGSIPVEEVERMCRDLRETCIGVFKQEIDELLYTEAQALRPFIETDPKINN